MGKATGFIDYQRIDAHYRPVEERIRDYEEVAQRVAHHDMQHQGARCMDCGIPYCHAMGCPVYNLVPEWNDLIYRGKWHEAYQRLSMTNNLPEITGRICPAPCEAACTLSINSSPVSIKLIEKTIIEHAFAQGWVVPCPPVAESGKSVAVIGSGPAGLSAAQQLRRAGHRVVLFEKADRIGGILRYGVPDFKLAKSVIDRRIEQMRQEGVVCETDVIIGEDLSVRYLKRSFDAVVLTLGAGQPRDLHVPGRGLEGIHFAMDYLKQSNRFVAGDLREHQMIHARGKNVLVIGGGDTGSDCVGTAIRQGAKSVRQFEIMPKPQEWTAPHNPMWPHWPTILRTSSSHEEGCEREWGVLTKHFSGRDVRVERAQCARVEWKEDPSGRPKMAEVPGSEFSLQVDLVLLAMGFLHVEHSRLLEDFGVALTDRGNVQADESYATSVPGVFAAGDAGTGASLVVRAIYHGRKAAEGVDRFLRG